MKAKCDLQKGNLSCKDVWCTNPVIGCNVTVLSRLLSDFVHSISPYSPYNESHRLRTKPPLLSIIIPSYNQALFLEQTLLSIINQKFSDCEIIVIDGGSTDGTVEILDKYDDYISFWVSEKDSGQTNAINKGLRIAKGEWVAFQNSDDIYLPGALDAISFSILSQKNKRFDVVYGDMLRIDNCNKLVDLQLTAPVKPWQQFASMQFHNQTAFWRRSFMVDIGELDEEYSFCLDYEFFTRMIMSEARCLHLNRFVGAQRFYVNTKTSLMSHTHDIEYAKILSKYNVTILNACLYKFFYRLNKTLFLIVTKNYWYLFRKINPFYRKITVKL